MVGWYVIKDSFIYPPMLGGKGNLYDLFLDFPHVNFPSGYSLYFTGTMGFHVSGLLRIVLAKHKAHDYMEMLFHHLCTLYLYGFSYLTNTYIGGVIAIVHDISDILVSFTRIFAESEYKKTTGTIFMLTLISWAYSRLFVLPYIIYVIIEVPVFGVSAYIKPIFVFLLLCLMGLHIYWFVLCSKIMLNFFTLGVTEDLQNKMDDKPLPEKKNHHLTSEKDQPTPNPAMGNSNKKNQ